MYTHLIMFSLAPCNTYPSFEKETKRKGKKKKRKKVLTKFAAGFLFTVKNRVGLALAKAAALRSTLNLDGAPITSKSHTHPSHSQTSRLLTSSLSLGNPVCAMHVDSSSLGFSLSSHRQSYIGLVFTSRLID